MRIIVVFRLVRKIDMNLELVGVIVYIFYKEDRSIGR